MRNFGAVQIKQNGAHLSVHPVLFYLAAAGNLSHRIPSGFIMRTLHIVPMCQGNPLRGFMSIHPTK